MTHPQQAMPPWQHHPLTYLLDQHGWKATTYLTRVAARYEALGCGHMARRPEKVTRWKTGTVPELRVQLAMADLHGVPHHLVLELGWPGCLQYACASHPALLDSPWTLENAVTALHHITTAAGGSMDRRKFVIVSAAAPLLAQAAAAQPATARTGGRLVGASTPALFEDALDALRRQDDRFGSAHVHAIARGQLALITETLAEATYTEQVGRRLHAVAAEAARICAWTAYDSGRHAQADEYYLAALRAAASSSDHVVAANTLAFWAIKEYSTGQPRTALDLTDAALRHARHADSPRLTAVLHARAARAHAHAGDPRAAAAALNAAMDAYDGTRDGHASDPACVYWVTLGELHMLAGSSALNLGRPLDALRHFEDAAAAHDAYQADEFPRGAAIYRAREAEARIFLGDLDGAVEVAHRAVDHMGGVSSARSSDTLRELRAKLGQHRGVPVVADFLQLTA